MENTISLTKFFGIKIHVIKIQVAENMLGILGARVLREEPKNTAKIVSLHEIST